MAKRYCMVLIAALTACPALGAEVSVIGAFGDKAAVLVIGGGAPRTVRVGQTTPEGITVLAVDEDRVTLRVGGKTREVHLGEEYLSVSGGAHRPRATFSSDASGHYLIEGLVDGGTVRFVLDTGATMVALPASLAERLGIDYRKGRLGLTQTANGQVSAWYISLDSVKVGEIELHNVGAIVIERGLNVALLGMSFLNRVEMRREGEFMTLTRRY